MKVLLFGKDGQVGFELARSLAPLGQVTALGRRECDLSDHVAIRKAVSASAPDLIVNAAAYTAVDKAESDREQAFAVNAQAPAVIGEEAQAHGALVVHYSTDYVFNGLAANAYRETDKPDPKSIYGESKLSGEQALQSVCARHLIFRTSWVVGAYGNNFAKTILRLSTEKQELNVVADQFGAPTSAALIADVTAHTVRSLLVDVGETRDRNQWYGLYHLAAQGTVSWFDYACYVVAKARSDERGFLGKEIILSPERIKAVASEGYPAVAERPKNSCLNTDKLRQRFSLHLPDWHTALDHILMQIL